MDNKKVAAELLKIAKSLVAIGTEDILQEFPQRNRAWHYDTRKEVFVAEASDLGRGTWRDPWNRPIKNNWLREVRDREGDIIMWKGYTTVKSKKVDLVIFND